MVTTAPTQINSQLVSFIVPVLDYSPASRYNIKTLIKDLSDIPGELIVVFNNQDVAHDLRNEKRINHFAVMSCNVGVSRAWNIGLEVCRTPIAFILNADLHIELSAVNKITQYLHDLPDAAMVGPQGSFFSFNALSDYLYFDKNTFDSPIQVDAVSGFLFALNMPLLNHANIRFDNQYTPCYQEEWDMGLQIKKAGLKSYVVPVSEYDHEWSGSIRAYTHIKFYDQELTPQEIAAQNKIKFNLKWREIAKTLPENFLQSGLRQFALAQVDQKIQTGNMTEALEILMNIKREFGEDAELSKRMLLIGPQFKQ
jgi:glycosyltransferase involved in cell wall biosynthesis